MKAEAPKDTPITIWLDSQSKQKLLQLAAAHQMRLSTFARRIIDGAICRLSEKPQTPVSLGDAQALIGTLLTKDLEDKVRLLTKDLESKWKLLKQQNPELISALEGNSITVENITKETLAFLHRIEGLLKAAGFSLETFPTARLKT